MQRAVRIGKRLVKIGLGLVGLFVIYLFLVAVAPGIAAPAQPLERTAPPPGQVRDAAAPDRTSVSFAVDSTPVSAWLYLPDDLSVPVPAVVMANGAGGMKDMMLPDYAARFRDAGFAVLAFDYRYWGESGGEPRQLIWIPDQVADLDAAIGYARGREEIDRSRIALWGTSFGGGHVITVAAEDHEIGAVIAQVPFLDGVAAYELEREGDTIGLSLLTLVHGQRDIARSWLGLSPNSIPIVGSPGTIAMMPGQEAWDFFAAHAPEDFVNEVPARIMIRADKYRPVTRAGDVQCPVLLQLAEHDRFVPASAIEATARMLGDRATLKRYDIGHFDIYAGDAFERSVADQVGFLGEHLR